MARLILTRPLDETLPEVYENAERLDSFDLGIAAIRARAALVLDENDEEC